MAVTKRVVVMIVGHSSAARLIAQGILQFCREHGPWQVHFEGTTEPAAIKRVEAAITKWRADGFIVDITNPHFAKAVEGSRRPAIDIACKVPSEIPVFSFDHEAAGRMVAQHFLERGHRNFGFWGGQVLGDQLQCKGFQEEVARGGCHCDSVAANWSNWIRILARLDAWLKGLPKPAAVMACNDYQAREVVWGCQRLGLAVPDDVAVVGSDNDELECGLCTTPISSVIWPARRVGLEAAKALDKAMRGGPAIKPLLLPPAGVATRLSSDSYALDDPDLGAAMRFIREHADRQTSVGDILKAVPISRRSLEWRFLKTLGRTPKAEILRMHIERAKTLLSETDLKMPQVAKGAGFSPHQVFSRIFRKVVGLKPTEYRLKNHL